ncbi:MAG: hypothetical protein J6L88_05880 [Clostridia bacterium]|nr:hypothetical protein [Clostridia bacterium]
MKKVLSILLAAVMLLSLFACGKRVAGNNANQLVEEQLSLQSHTAAISKEEPADTAGDPVVDAFVDFINSYAWTASIPAEELPEGDYESYEWGYYYFYDFNGDGVTELVMIVGTAISMGHCLVFKYDQPITLINSVDCAYGVGVSYLPGEPTVVLSECFGEYENFATVTVDVEGGNVNVTYDLPLLPEGAVPMEGTAIGEGYAGPAPATGSAQGGQAGGQQMGDEPPFNMPNERYFIGLVEDTYRDYDHSGIYVEQYYYSAADSMAHCIVALPVSHPYADEIIVCHVVAAYDAAANRLGTPYIAQTTSKMDWHVEGTWTLDGEGMFGTQGVSLRVDSVDAGYVNGAYKIIIEESTFGVADPTKVVEDSGSMYIEAPSHPFGIENCWEFVEVGSGDYMFYLNPDVGVYYSTDKSFTIGLQQMYPVH